MNTLPTHSRFRLAAFACSLLAGTVLAACSGDSGADNGSTSTVVATPTADTTPATPTATFDTTSTETVTATAPANGEVPAADQLRGLLLSRITTGDSSADQAALAEMEVVAIPLGMPERDVWAAVSTGPGIWNLTAEGARHVIAVYERRGDGSWVEVATLPLESEPTMADLELVPGKTSADESWIAVHGFTGAHSGTFDLIRFDGSTLTSELWWFNSSPGAASLEDIDGDGVAEVVLNATDPYVYCYACNVRAYMEIIYRWEQGELIAVYHSAVESSDQEIYDLTERAALFANAGLWRRAQEMAQLAVEAAPEDEEVHWLQIAIDRVATMQLADAGAEWQPLTSYVFAGEYEAAVDLMRALDVSEVFTQEGPLIAGTVADGWGGVTGDYLVGYATAALAVAPDLAAAYAVRALGYALLDAPDWGSALLDIEAALELEPGDSFYQAADAYLLEQNDGARG